MVMRRITHAPAQRPRTADAISDVKELKKRYHYTAEGLMALDLGIHACQSLGHSYFGTEHYLLGLTHELASQRLPRVTKVLIGLSIDPSEVWDYTVESIGTGTYTHQKNGRDLSLTPGAELTTGYIATRANNRPIDSINILEGLVEAPANVGGLILENFGINSSLDIRKSAN